MRRLHPGQLLRYHPVTDDFDFNQFDEVKELNEKAEPSVLLGFTLDTTPSLMNWQTASRLQSVTRASC